MTAPRPDAVELTGRRCRICTGGLIRVVPAGTTTVSCTGCGSSARAILSSWDLPYDLVMGPAGTGVR
jgi:hypothetical protein